jgi:hypothetical protein
MENLFMFKKGRELNKDKMPSGKDSVKETGIGEGALGSPKGSSSSSEGGQLDFLPNPDYGQKSRSTTSGQTGSGKANTMNIPFLPDKPE